MKYDLQERTLNFAKNIRNFVKKLPRTAGNFEDGKQLIRSSGSIGANYIEACDSLGKKDQLMRMRISRKEAQESLYWLNLVESGKIDKEEKKMLMQECTELVKILSSIIKKLG